MECLERSIIQLDLLTPGETYKIRINDSRRPREEDMTLVECYKDHYSFINAKGFKESLLKTDLFSGGWEVDGINPREKLLRAAGKMQDALKVKQEKETKSEIEEEVERIVNENTEKMVGEVTRWLKENPNQGGDVREIISEFDPSQYYIDKVRDAVVKELKEEGQEIIVTDGRPKKLILRVEEVADQDEVNEEVVRVEEETEMEEQEEELRRAEIIYPAWEQERNITEDRRFLEEKAEELQVRITDIEERLEYVQTRLTAEIDIYQELLDEINEHLDK